jgi:hypothetical protein
MANPLYGQNKFDESLDNYRYIENKHAFRTFDWSDLSLRPAAESTDAKTDTGFTMVDGEIVESLWDGDGAAASMILPAATKGALTVFGFRAQADGTASITFTTASSEYFEQGSICVPVSNLGDAFIYARRPTLQTTWLQSVAVGAGAVVTISAAHNTFIIAATGTNNQTNIGADLAFFCNKKGYWRIGLGIL